jgi:glycosyltransferase involved in cell wall biosynthesis
VTSLSVIVTTYNRPDALEAAFGGYLAQSDRDFRLVVADDGSGPETAEAVSRFARSAPFPVLHVWQEDLGFRAAAARNRALAAAGSDYIVFSDGDCVPLPGFVAGHRRLAEEGWFVTGNRVLLSRGMTDRVILDPEIVRGRGAAAWARGRLRGEVNRLLPLLPLPFPSCFRKAGKARWEGAMTCNLAAWRSDLLRVNGLDESYSGWGLEDSDLVIRLLRSGVRRKSARFAAPVLHLWHREQDRSALAENRLRLEAILKSDRVRAARGVDRYLQGGL